MSILDQIKRLASSIIGVDYDMPGTRYNGPFQPLTSSELDVQRNLESPIHVLAHEIGPRSVFNSEAYGKTVLYISDQCRRQNVACFEQPFSCACGKKATNIIARLNSRSDANLPRIIVGAHFDTVEGVPGANDNSSGVAALLQIAGLLQGRVLEHPIELVFFTNEEPPFFGGPDMGSRHFVENLRKTGMEILGMICLETIGYYSETPDSQDVPLLIGPLFKMIDPQERGNFIGFFGNTASALFLKEVIGHFRESTQFPSEGLAGDIDGIDLSDNLSFWEKGYPAIMVTDTAPMRYPHYHSTEDTEDKINFPCFARVVAGLAETIARIANGRSI